MPRSILKNDDASQDESLPSRAVAKGNQRRMTPIAEQSPPVSAKEWWSRRRGRYNIGLVKAGLLAFVCYVAVVFWGSSIGAIPDADINLFTTIFQGVAYLFMMVIANLCYSLGPLSERII